MTVFLLILISEPKFILILLLVPAFSYAEDDEWHVHDFGEFIVASVPGEVVHGDKLRFVINKKNCNKLGIMFSFLSYKNPKRLPSLEGKQVPFRINGSKTLLSANILLVKPAFGNYSYFVMFSSPEFYLIDEMSTAIMKAYRSKNKFSIELGKAEDFNPEDYKFSQNDYINHFDYGVKKAVHDFLHNYDYEMIYLTLDWNGYYSYCLKRK